MTKKKKRKSQGLGVEKRSYSVEDMLESVKKEQRQAGRRLKKVGQVKGNNTGLWACCRRLKHGQKSIQSEKWTGGRSLACDCNKRFKPFPAWSKKLS